MSNTRPRFCTFEMCKKKIVISDFACRCSQYYCSQHRDPEIHTCGFDYRNAGVQELLKTMSTAVIGKKIELI